MSDDSILVHTVLTGYDNTALGLAEVGEGQY